MANNYMDMTGVLKLDAVTPVITALFGGFKLDPTTPGNGQVSIAAGTEKNIVSWACVCSDLADLAVTLGTGIGEQDMDDMSAVLEALAIAFNCHEAPFIAHLVDCEDWDGDAELSVLFAIATRFDDGHGLSYFSVEGAYTCNRQLLGQFGGFGEFCSKEYSICEGSNRTVELGNQVHDALVAGDSDSAAEVLLRQVTSLLDGIADEEVMRQVRQKVAARLAVLPPKKVSAKQFAADKGHGNMDSCTTLLTARHDGESFEFRICGAGKDAYFEWINELGTPIGNILDEIETPEQAKKEFLNWLA